MVLPEQEKTLAAGRGRVNEALRTRPWLLRSSALCPVQDALSMNADKEQESGGEGRSERN